MLLIVNTVIIITTFAFSVGLKFFSNENIGRRDKRDCKYFKKSSKLTCVSKIR